MDYTELKTVLTQFYAASNLATSVYTRDLKPLLTLKRSLAPEFPLAELSAIDASTDDIQIHRTHREQYYATLTAPVDDLMILVWNNQETLEAPDQFSSMTDYASLQHLIANVEFLFYSCYHQHPITSNPYGTGIHDLALKANVKAIDQRRLSEAPHNDYFKERFMLDAVTRGNLLEYKQRVKDFVASGIMGDMALQQTRNAKNLLLSSVTLTTRAAIEGGLYYEQAFTISDYYCQKIEKMTSVSSITQSIEDIGAYFIQHVRASQKYANHTVIFAIQDYVFKHLHQPLTLDDIAQAVGYSKPYLCRLFKRELHKTIIDYVTAEKIREAQYQLLFSFAPVSDIAQSLGFDDQSYFSKVFTKYSQVSPRQYRSQRTHPSVVAD